MSAFRLVQNGGELLVDGGQRGGTLLQGHPLDLVFCRAIKRKLDFVSSVKGSTVNCCCGAIM